MSSSVNRRRPKRRQPHRNCKRLRYEKGCEPRLLGLPDELLLYTLEFAVLSEDEFATEIWKWLDQLTRVCRIFRQLTRELVPRKFHARFEEVQTRTALLTSLVRSFSKNPWKTAKLEYFQYDGCNANDRNHDSHCFLEALLALIETPGALTGLDHLRLQIANDGGIFDADFLYAIAQNLPNLFHLCLQGGFKDFALGRRVTPQQFHTFGKMFLKTGFKALTLSACDISDAHLNEFIRDDGSNLVSLGLVLNDLDNRNRLADSTLGLIRKHCGKLRVLSVADSDITFLGLAPLLRVNRRIQHLDISDSSKLGPDIIPALVHGAPQLEFLGVSNCDWFTDDCLDRLVQGQIDNCKRAGQTEISLGEVDVMGSSVSQAGILRVMSKPGIGSLRILLE